MSSGAPKFSEKKLAELLADARQQGLPEDWTLNTDEKGRKRWTSPKGKNFTYLQRALDHANGISKAKAAKNRKRPPSKISGSTNTGGSKSSGGGSGGGGGGGQKSKKQKKGGKSVSKASAAAKSSSASSSKANMPSSPIRASSATPVSAYDGVESDPETSLDVPTDFDEHNNSSSSAKKSSQNGSHRCTGTVHWDPNSEDGSKVGYRLRVWDDTKSYWRSGRIVRYDPISHKHKVIFFEFSNAGESSYTEEWRYLNEENVQMGGKFVWALVKGFAWWPAQVLRCTFSKSKPLKSKSNVKDLTSQPVRDGYVLVEFFDSDEVASVKDSSDFIRPFHQGAVDAVMRKNKKKRNAKAVETARQEEDTTREVRNDAVRFYAERAFDCINVRANYLLGARVEIFRADINYPVGEHCMGLVRNYSTTTKKYLIYYEPPPVNTQKLEPSWVNLTTQRYKVVDELKGMKRKSYVPNEIDVYPFLFGHKEKDGSSGSNCRGCIAPCDAEYETVLVCSKCQGFHHPGCLDPPMSQRTAESILKNEEQWTCSKCIRCSGCRDLEIAIGCKPVSKPSTLYLPRNATLQLCTSCTPMYDKDVFCPICAHVWDDARYQKIQHRKKAALTAKKKALSSLPPKKRKALAFIEDAEVLKDDKSPHDGARGDLIGSSEDRDSTFRWKLPESIDNSWYYPENNVWGYNEGTMLGCEKCDMWVHAGCAELSKEEYEQTTQGEHPIYSKEFLCRSCCKEKCIEVMNLLQNEDTMFLFAAPVTDKMAHNYSDVIKKPMDLQTMTDRAHIGNYRNYAWLRESFELMVYNALVFNHPQSKYWNEAKRFYNACKKNIFVTAAKGAPASEYKALIKERFELSEKMVQAEKDRVKADKTAQKKDLVAGSNVLTVKLGPLVQPPDPPSCVLTTVVKMKPVDAFYSSWLESCFSCGSSGAVDTMLFCVDCGEAYHSFCATAPIHSMNDAAVDGWRCPNCKLCEITGQVTDDETKLLYCEMCDRAFSLDLISPPLSAVPSGLWICGQCVDCTECSNTCDKGLVSRTFWSQDPKKCLPCGGCDALSLKCLQDAKCAVCKKLHRDIENLPECSTCKSFIHIECDEDAIKAFRTGAEGEKYSCLRCRKRAIAAAKRREERARIKERKKERSKEKSKETIKMIKEKKKEKKKDTKAIVKKVKKEPPKKLLSKEELREQALAIAMKEAKKRGLPDGWGVFYGSANRKRWRSPAPNSRVFDSIPKALLYAERMKKGEHLSRAKSGDKKNDSGPSFKFFALRLDLEPDWQTREKGYDESTSLMSDAEVLLKILEAKIEKKMSLIFDRSGKVFKASLYFREEDLPSWVLSRAGRFVRFVRRLRNRSARTTRRRGMMSNRSAQTVVCKMASAFIYSICIMFKVDIKKTIRCWKKMETLLIPVDETSGTVDLKLDEKKKRYTPHQVESVRVPTVTLQIPDGVYRYDPEGNVKINTAIIDQAETLNQTMAQISYHKLDIPTESIDHVPMALSAPESVALSSRPSVGVTDGGANKRVAPMQVEGVTQNTLSYAPKDASYDPLCGKTENEYNIASALMMLTTTPTRVKKPELSNTSGIISLIPEMSHEDTRDLQGGTRDGIIRHGFSPDKSEHSKKQEHINNNLTSSPSHGFSVKLTSGAKTFAQGVDLNYSSHQQNTASNSEGPNDKISSFSVTHKQSMADAALLLSAASGAAGHSPINSNHRADMNVSSAETSMTFPASSIQSNSASTFTYVATKTGKPEICQSTSSSHVHDLPARSSITPAAKAKLNTQELNPSEKANIISDKNTERKSMPSEVVSKPTAVINFDVSPIQIQPPNEVVPGNGTTAPNSKSELPTISKEYADSSMEPLAADHVMSTTAANQNVSKEISAPPDCQTHISKTADEITTNLKPALNVHPEVVKSTDKNEVNQAEVTIPPSAALQNRNDSSINNDAQATSQKKASPTKAIRKKEITNKPLVNLPWFTHKFTKVEPMMGWKLDTGSSNPSNAKTWMDTRTCCLCHVSGDDDAGLEPQDSEKNSPGHKFDSVKGSGRLLPMPNGLWVHTGCAIWSSEVWENPVGGIMNGVAKAKARSNKLRCFGCGQIGATLGCHKSNCHANFHFPCAKACGVVFTATHKLYCAAHANLAKDEVFDDFSEPMKILRVAEEKAEVDPSHCIRSGTLVVHSLGQIEPERDGFHSQQYITPHGYSSTRIFWSFMEAKTRTVYFMRIIRSKKNTAFYTVTAADCPTQTFKGDDVCSVYDEIMERVRNVNKDYFSHGDHASVFPMVRSLKNRGAFCLNGPQFFGFGVNCIREALEKSVNVISLAVPLSEKSTPYQFCFKNPTQQSVTDLQRKRAVAKAEKDLENVSGCARTEGISAIVKSKGSGRITRALVRNDPSSPSRKARTKGGADTAASNNGGGGRDPRARNDATSSREFESIQAKYREMKSVPMEQRLAAKRSHIHGWGLFAKKDYPKNSMIAEYMGEGISQPLADKREKMYEVLGMGSCYMFRLDLHEIVDATQIGCMARFMNHCCDANAYANIITVNLDTGLKKKIVVFAQKDIKSGDEITYDYKFPVEDGSLRCTCGAPNCIGRMN